MSDDPTRLGTPYRAPAGPVGGCTWERQTVAMAHAASRNMWDAVRNLRHLGRHVLAAEAEAHAIAWDRTWGLNVTAAEATDLQGLDPHES